MDPCPAHRTQRSQRNRRLMHRLLQLQLNLSVHLLQEIFVCLFVLQRNIQQIEQYNSNLHNTTRRKNISKARNECKRDREKIQYVVRKTLRHLKCKIQQHCACLPAWRSWSKSLLPDTKLAAYCMSPPTQDIFKETGD